MKENRGVGEKIYPIEIDELQKLCRLTYEYLQQGGSPEELEFVDKLVKKLNERILSQTPNGQGKTDRENG